MSINVLKGVQDFEPLQFYQNHYFFVGAIPCGCPF